VPTMEVRFLPGGGGVEEHSAGDLPELLARDDGFVWVDVATYDDEAEHLLKAQIGTHDLVLRACRERNHLPATHAYRDHLFVVLHAPEIGSNGHVHLLELDQLVGERYVVTVHGPVNPAVPLERALVETQAMLARLESGRFAPDSPMELSYAIVSAIVRRQRAAVSAVAERVPPLEARVMGEVLRDPEALLEEMFLLRHELVTVRTMAAQSHDVYARLAHLRHHVDESHRALFDDLADQFARVRSFSDGEKEFLVGVIDLYQTRVTTKMTVAMERLAVLAAVTLPVTAIASVYGMNVIVNAHTHVAQLLAVLAVMAVICAVLLRWTKRQGWW
jgi:Mg2+ and Co2+ transporter CorA